MLLKLLVGTRMPFAAVYDPLTNQPASVLPPAIDLSAWGFGDWYRQQATESDREGWEIARVLNVNRTNWTIQTTQGPMRAELSGRLSWIHETASQRPTAGDWVWIQIFDDGEWALIDGVLPRRTELKRKSAGELVDEQIIAANVDAALIVQACDRDFNPSRLDRYLVTVRNAHIQPFVILSKSDLVPPPERDRLATILSSRVPDAKPLFLSAQSGEGIDELRSLFAPGQTICLLGSSGVGKTTLLNALLGSDRFSTKEVREDDHRGRHTTTRRHLEPLPGGALMIDTPGMRELGLLGSDEGLEQSFTEIEALTHQCHFNDCAHESETGCAVQAAVEAGNLDPERLRSWKKLAREAARHQWSLAEKRRRDKEQGKLYKRIQQAKRDRR